MVKPHYRFAESPQYHGGVRALVSFLRACRCLRAVSPRAALAAGLLVVGVRGGASADILRVPEEYPTIQSAVDAAVDGDEIVVGPGTYPGKTTIVDKVLTIRASGRRNDTVLDGEAADRVFEIISDNGLADIHLEGFTIANGAGGLDGGGIHSSDATIEVTDCRFTGNSAQRGGGIFHDGERMLRLVDCTFDRNTASTGAGVCLDFFGSVEVTRCLFRANRGNEAFRGGSKGGLVSVVDSTFRNNDGCGFNSGYLNDVVVSNCLFENNHNPGGWGGGVNLDFEARVTMENCIVRGNSARAGAGIYSYAHPFTIRDCLIEDNVAEQWGGGFDWDTGAATLERCVIRHNSAGDLGGGVHGWEGGYGDASDFADCIIAGNDAPVGSQIGLTGMDAGDSLTIIRSAIEGGLENIYFEPGWHLIWGGGNTSLIPAELLSATVAHGTLVSGTVEELRASDDLRLRAQSRFGFTALERNVIDLRISAENIVTDPAEIQIAIESRINVADGTCRVRLRNWSNAQFQVLHTYLPGQLEETELVERIPAANFVRADDERIELSLRTSALATFSAQGFDAFYDIIEVRLE